MKTQRQRRALLSGNSLEYERYSGRTFQCWLGHETIDQVMEYVAWIDSQSETARAHANREDTRYQAAALLAPCGKLALAEKEVRTEEINKKAETEESTRKKLVEAQGIERLERHWAVIFQGNALLSGKTDGDNIRASVMCRD